MDLGGGVGVRYTKENPFEIYDYAKAILPHIRPLGCHLLLEPGRAIVGPAGVLLTRVLYVKRNRGKIFIVVDAAMNDFIRPALYSAIHPITHVARKSAKRIRADIVGGRAYKSQRIHVRFRITEAGGVSRRGTQLRDHDYDV